MEFGEELVGRNSRQKCLSKKCRSISACSLSKSLVWIYTVCNFRYTFSRHYSYGKETLFNMSHATVMLENLSSGFLTRSNTNQTVRPQKMIRDYYVAKIKALLIRCLVTLQLIYAFAFTLTNIAKSEQSSHTPSGSHHRPYHFNWKERKMDK